MTTEAAPVAGGGGGGGGEGGPPSQSTRLNCVDLMESQVGGDVATSPALKLINFQTQLRSKLVRKPSEMNLPSANIYRLLQFNFNY